ncbi:MAG TPA: hypothetical protein VFV93_14770 [Thermomicrobiales bacterium]|nr:hypothetical protein [Thermomicrobiales bacterium]
MPVDTQTLPGTIYRGENGEELARGWCLVTYEMVGNALPLDDWRGEIAVTTDEYDASAGWGDELYIRFRPYGGVWEPWHGPVTVEQVDPEIDPNRRRLRLRPAGPLTRSRYTPDELAHGWPAKDETPAAR